MGRQDVKNFTLQELKKLVAGLKEPIYRADQVFSWLYKKGVCNFSQMENLPKGLIDRLKPRYYIGKIELSKHLKSKEEAEKFLFRLSDGNFIETVFIYAQKRKTVCLSTQVGCKFACPFCASGQTGFVRDLEPSEIISQILFLQHNLKHTITNYVFMGMGEPLDNYENTMKAILIMNERHGLDIASRRITVSTCGIIPGIDKLKDLGLQVNLSISLHAADNKLRNELVPINRKYPLEELVKACRLYIEKTKKKITLEYILIKDKNHSLQDAEKIAEISKKLIAKVNLITYNAVKGMPFKAPAKQEIDLFMKQLLKKKINATLRKSKGQDIQAACGQLVGKGF